MDVREAYSVLELAYGAPLAELEAAYKTLVAVWHPDRYAHNPELRSKAEKKLLRINAAYQVVRDALEAGPQAVEKPEDGHQTVKQPEIQLHQADCLYLGDDPRIKPPQSNLAQGIFGTEPSRHAAIAVTPHGLLLACLFNGQPDDVVRYPTQTFAALEIEAEGWGESNAAGKWKRPFPVEPGIVLLWFRDPEGIIRTFIKVRLRFENTYHAQLFAKRVREAYSLLPLYEQPTAPGKVTPDNGYEWGMAAAIIFLFLLVVIGMVVSGVIMQNQARTTGDDTRQRDPSSAERNTGPSAGEVRNLSTLEIPFRWCPPGSFKMGSPSSEIGRNEDEGQVDVTLAQGFWMTETEVTQSQWKAVMGTTPWIPELLVRIGADYPATTVGWPDAEEFCKKLTNRDHKLDVLPLDWKYTLPTEAEWEYACRAGTTEAYSFGNDAEKLGDYAWWGGLNRGNADTDNERFAHRVGLKKSNPWGLKDMHGNVWEWCLDRNVSNSRSRVLRGGSWIGSRESCQSTSRWTSTPSRSAAVGFRFIIAPAN